MAVRSGLLELDQRAAEILRVQEQHRLAVGADLRLAATEHARAARQPVARGLDVVDLVADVVDAAVGLRSRKAIGDPSPSGSRSSILVFGSATKTTVTPCSGCGTGADTSAPRVSR